MEAIAQPGQEDGKAASTSRRSLEGNTTDSPKRDLRQVALGSRPRRIWNPLGAEGLNEEEHDVVWVRWEEDIGDEGYRVLWGRGGGGLAARFGCGSPPRDFGA